MRFFTLSDPSQCVQGSLSSSSSFARHSSTTSERSAVGPNELTLPADMNSTTEMMAAMGSPAVSLI